MIRILIKLIPIIVIICLLIYSYKAYTTCGCTFTKVWNDIFNIENK